MEATKNKPASKSRVKSPHIIQIRQGDGNLWVDLKPVDGPESFEDTTDAKSYIKKKGMTGEFRIIAVKGVVKAEAETKTVIRIT